MPIKHQPIFSWFYKKSNQWGSVIASKVIFIPRDGVYIDLVVYDLCMTAYDLWDERGLYNVIRPGITFM